MTGPRNGSKWGTAVTRVGRCWSWVKMLRVTVIKRLTMVRRASGVASDEFASRWRAHAEMALGSMPASARPSQLAHCVTRPGSTDPLYDGVAVSWHEDPGALALHDAWVAADGSAETVIDVEATTCVHVEERIAIGGAWLANRWQPIATASCPLLIGFIEAIDGLTREQFRDYWWDQHRPLANRLVPDELEPVAYVHNYVAAGEPGRWAGIGEMYEHSLAVARKRGQWFDSDASGPLVADEERFLVRETRQVIVTDHEVIHASSTAPRPS